MPCLIPVRIWDSHVPISDTLSKSTLREKRVVPDQVLTRTLEVSRVLCPVLSSYEVIRMAPGEIERQARTTGELRFRFHDTDCYFNLEPHDMRTPNYRAVETGPGGVRRTLPRQPVPTFKGVLAGREDTRGPIQSYLRRCGGSRLCPRALVLRRALAGLRSWRLGRRTGHIPAFGEQRRQRLLSEG